MTAPAGPVPRLPSLDLPALVARTESLLRGGVPLTLLLDLADPQGPRSGALYGQEPADLSWLS